MIIDGLARSRAMSEQAEDKPEEDKSRIVFRAADAAEEG
jgi:hypothetical protein